jgi:hypothetical protein
MPSRFVPQDMAARFPLALHACNADSEAAGRGCPMSPPQKGTVRDTNLSSDAHVRPDGPEFPSRPLDVQAVLRNYKPRLLSATWDGPIASFVLDAVRSADLASERSAREAAGALARLAAWALEEGLPLDPEVVLDPAVVDRYVTGLKQSQRSAQTQRSLLRRLGRAATKLAPWEPKSATLGRRMLSPPLSDDEVDRLWRMARAQPTEALRQAAECTLFLGLGVGADGRWLPYVRPEDVHRWAGGVAVAFSEPGARRVPVLASMESGLQGFAASVKTPYLFGPNDPSRNLVSRTLGRLVTDGSGLRLSPARLRSTWLMFHVQHGTRLPELAHAAGMAGVTVLSDLLPLVEPADDQTFVRLLRGTQ